MRPLPARVMAWPGGFLRRTLSISIVPLVLLTGGTSSAQTVRVISDRPFPPAAARALDIRWASDDSIDVTTMDHGVLQYKIDDWTRSSSVAFAPARGFCWTCSVLATSGGRFAGAFPTGPIAWTGQGVPPGGPIPFEAVVDLDLQGDHLLVLGSRRDATGQWAPDAAIAWLGTLGKHLTDLRPVHYSSAGPKAMVYGRCGFVNAGGARFYPDGSFIVVPGVDPGAYRYSADGKLLHAWRTDKLGILDRCDLSDADSLLYMRNPEARQAWLSHQRVVDDVLPLPAGPALVIREVRGGQTSWTLIMLRERGDPVGVSLPFRSPSDVGWLKADVRGNRLAILIGTWGRWRKPPTDRPARLIIAELQP